MPLDRRRSDSPVCPLCVFMKNYPLAALVLLLLYACAQKQARMVRADELYHEQDTALAQADSYSDTIEIRYAKGLQVSYEDDGIHVTLVNPDPSSRTARPETFIISQPATRFITTTALQLGNFEVLGLEDRVVGMNSLRHVFSPRILAQQESGYTVSVGKEGNFDIEKVMACRPDYILVSASKFGGFETLRETGITLIPHHGYKETDPLGQAEWIKLIGLLTGETKRANAVFANIERKYQTLRQEVQEACKGNLPTVMSGRQMRDGWYIVGGRSYMARLFSDAGAAYVMAENEESGGVTLDFEKAYASGIHADFWQTDGSCSGEYTMETLSNEDARYATMDAYTKGQVIFCNLSQTPYRELAGVQPHLMLADFVKAFHPEILPTYQPTYYKILK